MAKKKKSNSSQLQKIEAARRRNEFFERLKQFCDQVTEVPVFHLIPPAHLDEIYKLRSHPVRIKAANGHDVPADVLKEAKAFVAENFKKMLVNIGIGKMEEMPLHDFMTIGLTLMLYADRLNISDYPKAELVKFKLLPLLVFAQSPAFAEAWSGYFAIMDKVSLLKSDLTSYIYVLKHEEAEEFNYNPGIYFCFDIYCVKTPKIQVMIDGINRPAYRVGWLLPEDFSKFTCLGIDIELPGYPHGISREVYIQSHALERLSERVDGVDKGFLHFSIYDSLKKPTVFKNKKGDWLFEYTLLGKRVGYFKADMVDDKLILRTFLFLTNNGTPEGEALHAHTGIMKEDKMYLTIDKFSSFIHSDIQSNETVKDIFIKAGCESLFEVNRSVYAYPNEARSLANLIENYLKREQTVSFRL